MFDHCYLLTHHLLSEIVVLFGCAFAVNLSAFEVRKLSLVVKHGSSLKTTAAKYYKLPVVGSHNLIC